MARSLPSNPSLEHLAKQAKALLRDARKGEAEALALLGNVDPARAQLSDAQVALAREYGFASWPKLKAHVESASSAPKPEDHVAWFSTFQDLVGPIAQPVSVPDRLTREVDVLRRAHADGDAAATVPLRFYVAGLRDATVEEILDRPLTEAEAQTAIAQMYIFNTWDAVERSGATIDPTFEAAVDTVVTGDLAGLDRRLDERPELVAAHSAYGHGSTLLHYVAANGVEIRRQQTPANIVEIARRLLEAGAEVDALCGTYGGGANQTPLCLLVSSGHPADAGVQGDLVEVLLDAGAAIDGVADDGMPLNTALAFRYRQTAELLVERGARVDNLVVAAGLGRMDLVKPLLTRLPQRYVDPFGPVITDPQDLLDRAFFLAAQQHHVDLVRLLLDGGAHIDVSLEHERTALHWVSYAGHTELVELLLERGADPTRRDSYYHATPADWAREGGHPDLARRLQSGG